MTSISQNWYIYGLRAGDSEYRYVGFTTKRDPQSRLKQHFRDAQRFPDWPIYRWLSRQDPDQVILEVLEVCPPDRDVLYARERYWIAHFRDLQGSLNEPSSDDYLLNILDGGGGRLGMPHSEAARQKMRTSRQALAISGWSHTEESKRKISESQKGKTFSEETRAKLSAAKIGNKQSGYALHVRHHVNKTKTNPSCQHCTT